MNQSKMMFIVMVLALTVSACKSKKEAVYSSEPSESTTKTKERARKGGKKGPPSADEVFKMDVNQDGKLSKTEVKGPLLRDFDKIDTDSDGFITREELENVPKRERKERPDRG